MKKAYIIGTADTKFQELRFVRQKLEEAGVTCVLVDVGTTPHSHAVDITAREVAAFHPGRPDLLDRNEGRGDAVTAMSEALEHFLPGRADLGGVIGLGGSGGTALVTRGMRSLAVGIPKVMVSTVASGNTAPYVGASDIFMLYSITDIAGINQVSYTVLGNAANALAGMIKEELAEFQAEKPALGLTMFGVTTPCVNYIREKLSEKFDCLVFHATGTGGRSMEKLIDSGFISHVIDVTTTEICDLHMGGVMSAGEDRMGAIIRRKIPYVGSVGALDMVNFGAIDTMPDHYKGRLLYRHNAQVTLMRTTVQENIAIGKWIADKLNQMQGPVRFFLPEEGVSLLSEAGQPFFAPEADAALLATLEESVRQNGQRKLVRLPCALNDPAFAQAMVEGFMDIAW